MSSSAKSRVVSIDDDEFFSPPSPCVTPKFTTPEPTTPKRTRTPFSPAPASRDKTTRRFSPYPVFSPASRHSSPSDSSSKGPLPRPSIKSVRFEDQAPKTPIRRITVRNPTTLVSGTGETSGCRSSARTAGRSVRNEEESTDLIPKPNGELGRPGRGGYSLKKALKWDDKLYNNAKARYWLYN
ncbi:hypothetical protein VKT23_020006 [Stygiomarasmius scandens]|uniref:Uncharacterized protein n=1 Tax=Marasmiellus scandens TaxID=2682957 RepID=A0ABR1IMT4_9AGAR